MIIVENNNSSKRGNVTHLLRIDVYLPSIRIDPHTNAYHRLVWMTGDQRAGTFINTIN